MKILTSHFLILVLADFAYSQQILNVLPEFYLKSTSTSMKANPDYVKNLTCKLKAVNWERSVLDAELDLVQALRNVTIHGELFKYTNQFRPFLLNLTFNYCELFEKGHTKNAYVQTVVKIVAKFSNVVHKCPFSGHLYVRNAFVDANMLSFYMPLGKYKLLLTFFEDWPPIQIGVVNYVFEIADKKQAARGRL